ncbi:MAG: hypothetical protein A2749_01165 [Parcubacteria group bacterium RIFCSPHIGHO2_01_FULL_45_26]|nr:MAG: hypothetical protein A2749_01165 [Parcubacteria group bacterium RIFCSPHIGHO2_01_FULL_45_26]
MSKRNKGFTLIELLVVIAIIGILSSVVLASLNNAREKARDARRISDIKNVQLAMELNADDNNGNYAASLAALVPDYISVVPTDPLNSAAYNFASETTEYHVGTTLENANNMPDNDADCDSNDNAPGNCFKSAPLANGTPFDGSVAKVYDQKQ